MKHIWKRALALLFALALMLALAAPAMAEESEEGPVEDPGVSGETPAEEPGAPGDDSQEPGDGSQEPGNEEPGTEETPAEEPTRFFVSAEGNDETGDGSESAPFATLARAAAAANAVQTGKVVVVLKSDLKALDTARFTGRDVTLQAAEGTVTVTRQEGFHPVKDASGVLYNPAMIEFAPPQGDEEQAPAGALTLIGVILDDAGLHQGSLFELTEESTAKTADGTEEESSAETPETAEETPAADEAGTEEAEEAKPADRTELVQEAIVTVGKGGSLVLGAGTELRNFGGRSAVSLGDKSSLRMMPGSAIQDTLEANNELPALLRAESAAVEVQEGAKLIERTGKPDSDADPGAAPIPVPSIDPVLIEPTEAFRDISFEGPESITRLADSSLLKYPVNYSLRFSVSEDAVNFLERLKDQISGGEGTITITLDPRLTPDLSKCTLNSGVFQLVGSPAFDESSHTLTAAFELKADWTSHLSELTEPMTFPCETSMDAADFDPSTASENKYLESKAQVSLKVRISEKEYGPYSSTEKTAKTQMLGLPTSTLTYDVNGGKAGTGPAPELISETEAYTLKTEPAPTHDPQDGVAVIFAGWTETKDSKIYATGDQAPATVKTIKVEAGKSITVYAVYSLDTNGDGVPDVDQILATLSFDANGGQGAPDPIIHVVGSLTNGELGVDIPEQEPTRDYYTFLGWGEKPDATKDDKLYKHDAEKASRRDIPVTKDTTLYAVWKENYKIIYDANGGSNAPEPTVLKTMTKTGTDSKGNPIYSGQAVITSEVPTREGYTFRGWAVTRRSAASYFAGNKVEISSGDVTLYAVWTKGASGGTNGPKTGDEDAGVYAALLCISAAGLAATGGLLWKKRRGEA